MTKKSLSYEAATLAAFPELLDFALIKEDRDYLSFLDVLYQNNFVSRYINFLLKCMHADGHSIPLGSAAAVGIISANGSTMILRYYDPAKAKQDESNSILHSLNTDVFLKLISKETICFPNYQYNYNVSKNLPHNFEVMKLERLPDVDVRQGDIYACRANRDVGDYKNIDKKAIFLAITTFRKFEYTFAFDRLTRKAIQIIAGDNQDTRVEYVSKIFAELDATEAIPQMVGMMKGATPTGRWQIARDIHRPDHAVGRELIASLASHDADLYVRKAAQKSLDLLG